MDGSKSSRVYDIEAIIGKKMYQEILTKFSGFSHEYLPKESADENLKNIESIQNESTGKRRKHTDDNQSINKKMKEDEAPTDTTQQNIEPIISKSFVVRCNIEGLGKPEFEFRDFFQSEEKEHFGVFWRFCMRSHDGCISVYLYCTRRADESIGDVVKDELSIETDIEMKLMSKNGEDYVEKKTFIFRRKDETEEHNCCEWKKFMSQDRVEANYVKDDCLYFEVSIKIKKMAGINPEILRDFGESKKKFSDLILVVDNQKFYVSKLFLATHSPYFESLFLGNFEESRQSEIKLSGIDAADFQKYLECLYGDACINDFNVEGILLIADMYVTQIITGKCEEFLLKGSTKKEKKKFELAVRFNLKNLKNELFEDAVCLGNVSVVLPDNFLDLDQSIIPELIEMTFYNNYRKLND